MNLCDRTEDLALQVLAEAPDRFALIGHDLGGIVAMEVVRRAPHRVSRIALLSTNAQSETPVIAAAREERIVAAKSGRLEDVLRDEISLDNLAPGPNRADIYAIQTGMAAGLGADAYVNQCRAMQRRPDQQKTLRKLKIPTLIMCGQLDRVTPARRHEFLATLVNGATLEIISGAGHLPTLEQPVLTTEILEGWLVEPLVLRQPLLRSA